MVEGGGGGGHTCVYVCSGGVGGAGLATLAQTTAVEVVDEWCGGRLSLRNTGPLDLRPRESAKMKDRDHQKTRVIDVAGAANPMFRQRVVPTRGRSVSGGA